MELGDRDLVGLDEHGGAPLLRSVGDGVSFLASCTANDDLGARLGSRNLDVEDARRLVSGDEERVRDACGDERPGLPAESVLAVVEPQLELAVEDEERLCDRLVAEHENTRPGIGPDLVCAELLDVDEHGGSA